MPGQLRHRRRAGAASAARRRDPVGRGDRRRPTLARRSSGFSDEIGRSGAGASAPLTAPVLGAPRHPRHRRRQERAPGATPARSRSTSKAPSSPAPPSAAGIPFLVAAHDRRPGDPRTAAGRADPAGRSRHAGFARVLARGVAPAAADRGAVRPRPRDPAGAVALAGPARALRLGVGRRPSSRAIASSTWREKTYSAGRCRSSGISGAIAPSVRTPRSATTAAFSGCCTVSATAVAS